METITKRGAAPLRMQRTPGDGPLDKTGMAQQYARFEFPFDKAAAAKGGKRFFSGHFDAYCPWRMDDPALETDAFAPDVGYTRMHYIMKATDPVTGNRALLDGGSASAALSRPVTPAPGMSESGHIYTPVRKYPYEPGTPLSRSIVPSPASVQNHPSFQKYESKRIVTEAVDLDDLAAYVRDLRPRCAHDFKPMCYLLQSLMGHLLAREIQFFSSEIRNLKDDLLRMQDLLDDADAKDKLHQANSIIAKFQQATKIAQFRSNLEDHGSYLLRANDEQKDEITELKAKLDACRAKCAEIAPQLENVKALRDQIKKANRDKDDALLELEGLRTKSESEKKTLRSISGQKDKKIAELQRKLDDITGGDDTAAQLAALSNESAELRRQVKEGGGVSVENGDYEAYAADLKRASAGGESDQALAEKVGKLSPAEAARVMQAIGDWGEAAKFLRGNKVDFISDVLTCGVLDDADVASALSHLGMIDGTVFFVMMRKTGRDRITGAMRAVHPSVAGGWLASAAAQAKSRLAVCDWLGAEAVVEIIHTQSEGDAVLVLDSQSPNLLAGVFEHMYRGEELTEAVELLLRCSGNTRTSTLDAMDDVVREKFLTAMNKEVDGSTSSACVKCGYCASNDDVVVDNDDSSDFTFIRAPGSLVFQKPLPEHEIAADPAARQLDFMQPPQSWMDYCEAGGRNKLLKKWEKDGLKVISPIKLRAMVTAIYTSKLKSDIALKRQEKHRVPLSEYVVQWFDNNYGLKKVAMKKMVCFIFSLQKIYEEGKDMRVCQFVRLSGMYHPLPNVLCDLLLECTEIISGLLSGSGEAFRSDTEFWSTWASGKMIAINKSKQLVIFQRVFGPRQDPKALSARLSDELADSPEVVPSYVILPQDSVSVSRLLSFTLQIVQEMNDKTSDASKALFRKAAGSDKKVSFAEFKKACLEMKPLTVPPEGSFAFMYWRAFMTNRSPSAKETLGAVHRWEEAMKNIGGGGDEAAVEVDVAVETFMWHCGVFNELGKQENGTSALEEGRLRSKMVKNTRAIHLG